MGKYSASGGNNGNTTVKVIVASLVVFVLGYLLRYFSTSGQNQAEPGPEEPDNLKVVEGIGPKIESIMHARGIKTLRQLADADPAQLRSILRQEGPRFSAVHDPTTWPKQAGLAAAEDWDELAAYKSQLKGGREVK